MIEDARELYRIAARDALRTLAEGDKTMSALFRRVVIHFDSDLRRLEDQLVEMLPSSGSMAFTWQRSARARCRFC